MKRVIDILFLIVLIYPITVFGLDLPNLNSKNVILYDTEAEEILFEKGEDKETPIASLTKIVTTIVAIENIENLDETVTISSNALAEVPYDASVAGLKAGNKVTYRDLLYASILPSGADATISLAHNIAGSTANFVKMMNEKASSLGLTHTNFVNVTGYDAPNHYSTPKEILEILVYALKDPLFQEIYKTRKYQLTNGLTVYSTLDTYNRYMKLDVSSILGSKTGYTGDAGMCMSALFETNGKEMIIITLGAPYNYVTPFNLKDTIAAIEYLDHNYDEVILFKESDEVVTIPIEISQEEEYVIRNKNDIKKYTEKNIDPTLLRTEFEGVKKLDFRNKIGDKIGTIKYYYMDELIATEDVNQISKIHPSLPKIIKKYPLESSLIVLLIFAVVLNYASKIKKKKNKKRKRK